MHLVGWNENTPASPTSRRVFATGSAWAKSSITGAPSAAMAALSAKMPITCGTITARVRALMWGRTSAGVTTQSPLVSQGTGRAPLLITASSTERHTSVGTTTSVPGPASRPWSAICSAAEPLPAPTAPSAPIQWASARSSCAVRRPWPIIGPASTSATAAESAAVSVGRECGIGVNSRPGSPR